jgi:hypothetical protein
MVAQPLTLMTHSSRATVNRASYSNDIVTRRHNFRERSHPRVQVMTALEVLTGKRPEMPWGAAPSPKPPTEKEKAEQEAML